MAKRLFSFIILIATYTILLTAQNKKEIIYFEDFKGNDIEDAEVCQEPLIGCFYEHITENESHSGS